MGPHVSASLLLLVSPAARAQEVVTWSTGAAVAPRTGEVVLEQDLWASAAVAGEGVGGVVDVWFGADVWPTRPQLVSAGIAPGLAVGERWWALVQPGLMFVGEPADVGLRHLQGTGLVLVGTSLPSGPVLSVGALGATALDGPWVLPAVGLELALGDTGELWVLLPAELSLRLGQRVQGGLDVTVEGWSHARGGGGTFTEYGAAFPGYLRAVGVFRWRVRGRVGVGAHLGVDLGRHLEETPAGRADRGALGPALTGGLDVVLWGSGAG
jgi:hypothetical protein